MTAIVASSVVVSSVERNSAHKKLIKHTISTSIINEIYANNSNRVDLLNTVALPFVVVNFVVVSGRATDEVTLDVGTVKIKQAIY